MILCPSGNVVEERANGRAVGARHDQELFEAFDRAGEFERFMVRDDTGSVEEIVEKMREGIQGGKYRLDFSTIRDES